MSRAGHRASNDRSTKAAASSDPHEAETPGPTAAEFPDDAKVTAGATSEAPNWQNDAYLLLNEFRAHGGILQFLQDKSSGMVHPATGQSVLRNLTSDDRAACVRLLLPFVADSRVARFCGVGPKDN